MKISKLNLSKYYEAQNIKVNIYFYLPFFLIPLVSLQYLGLYFKVKIGEKQVVKMTFGKRTERQEKTSKLRRFLYELSFKIINLKNELILTIISFKNCWNFVLFSLFLIRPSHSLNCRESTAAVACFLDRNFSTCYYVPPSPFIRLYTTVVHFSWYLSFHTNKFNFYQISINLFVSLKAFFNLWT